MRSGSALGVVAALLVAGCLAPGAPGPAGLAQLQPPPGARDVGRLLIAANATLPGTGSEPSIEVGPDGTIYVTAAEGLVRINQTAPSVTGGLLGGSRLWVSRDQGASFQEILHTSLDDGLHNIPSGFEGDVAVDQAGTAYFIDLSLASANIARSMDQGRTWELRNPAVFPVGGGDRAWVAAGPKDMVAVTWNQIPTGFWVAVSTDGGLTFPTQTYLPGYDLAVGDWTAAGPIAVGPEGNIYVARDPPGGIALFRSTDGGRTFARLAVHDTTNGTGYIFPVPSVDSAGTVYVAWIEEVAGNADVFYAFSRDQGDTWSAPVQVSHHQGSSAEVWVAAGEPGHLAVAFYGAPGAPGIPDETVADWYPFATEVWGADTTAPAQRAARLTDAPLMHAAVCTGGLTGCDETGGGSSSRALGDYLQVAFDPDGRPQVIWHDPTENVYWAVLAQGEGLADLQPPPVGEPLARSPGSTRSHPPAPAGPWAVAG